MPRGAHAPPDPRPPRPTNERGGQTRAPRGRRTKTTKNILDARVHYAVHNQPARNPPTAPDQTPQNPPPDEPGEQSLKETGPTKEGAPNPGRTAPEPDSMPRPHNHRPPARRGNGPELKDENKRLRGRVEGAVAGRQGEPPLPARVRPATLIRVRGRTYSKPLRKEVIQPHLPVRLPCYDFVPITGPAFDRSPWGHGLRASPTFMT